MKLNKRKLFRETGIEAETLEEILPHIKQLLNYLEWHNKNYTMIQQSKINTLISIFDSVEE